MTVKQLISQLQSLPSDAEVTHLWDGSAYTTIEHVWLARDGTIVTADFNMVCYGGETRPECAPTPYQDPYWRTPPNPNLHEDKEL